MAAAATGYIWFSRGTTGRSARCARIRYTASRRRARRATNDGTTDRNLLFGLHEKSGPALTTHLRQPLLPSARWGYLTVRRENALPSTGEDVPAAPYVSGPCLEGFRGLSWAVFQLEPSMANAGRSPLQSHVGVPGAAHCGRRLDRAAVHADQRARRSPGSGRWVGADSPPHRTLIAPGWADRPGPHQLPPSLVDRYALR
jgi:hypothetical protein